MEEVLDLLNAHHRSFFLAKAYADQTYQPTPVDSRAWSQILISLLVGINGRARQKGSDLIDGSDVKSANTWGAIDKPRFNGVIKSGTKSNESGNMSSLDSMPYLFFVLWDNEPTTTRERVRVWVVRTQQDIEFRGICETWYRLRYEGIIKSDNFQLHPPINKNTDVFTSNCGTLNYPLLLKALWNGASYDILGYDPYVLTNGQCTPLS